LTAGAKMLTGKEVRIRWYCIEWNI